MSKVRVMIVEDSRAVREMLEFIIGSDPRLEVAACAETGEDALRLLHRVSPDVISLDIRLPGINGFEVTRRVMAEKPTPIVVVSASVESDDLNVSMNALRAGALAVVEKPVGTTQSEYGRLAERICTQLAIMSEVKVIRQRLDRAAAVGPRASGAPFLRPITATPGRYRAVGIVASTGGPNALESVLGSLPADFPLPVLLVQHITGSFLRGFVSWLGGVCRLDVHMAAPGESIRPGTVYVAPADRHLYADRGRMRVDEADPVSAQRPSGTVLLRSMADGFGDRSIGVLLTGMGEDGALGLAAIRNAGGYTIAEDESTAVVYGMPGAAVRLGAACESLPLPEIAPRLIELANSPREPT